MKKHICIALILAMVLSLAACGAEPAVTTSAPTTQGATAPVETTAPPIPAPTDDPVLLARRQAVVDSMMDMATVRWTVAEDFTYEQGGNQVPLKAGTVYQGIPYGGGMSTYESFQDFLSPEPDDKGVYTLYGTPELLTGSKGTAPIGNSCSSALQNAWGRVSPTTQSLATLDMTAPNGCLSVGDYKRSDESNQNSKAMVEENGAVTMYRAYAQLQPGDAVVKYGTSSGHTMMVTEVHYEINAKGNVSSSSYVVVLHQTSTTYKDKNYFTDEATGQTVYPFYAIENKRTFAELFGEGYLPITCLELVDPNADTEIWVKDSETQYTADNILTGTLTSNGFMIAVCITVSQGDKTLQSVTAYSARVHFHSTDLKRFAEEDPAKLKGSLDLTALTPGSYHCTHEVLLPTGEWVTVRDFDFQK